ncbi:hypothetical protein ULM_35860 (plasmid) [Legionella pneumophila]|nr:hypothetical protein ULM_35860 [Legionella pneumophila]
MTFLVSSRILGYLSSGTPKIFLNVSNEIILFFCKLINRVLFS